MDILTQNYRQIHDFLRFHDALNPKIWDGVRMRIEVRLYLFRSAIAFYRFLDVEKLIVKDIVLTGSNAAYNYTRQSDLDVHLIVDFARSACPELADNFFNTKKSLWAETYNAEIRGHAIELYVEDISDHARSNGVYSILHGKWLHKPKKLPPFKDDRALSRKVGHYKSVIDNLLENPSIEAIDEFFGKLHSLRQSGLDKGGEYSIENLTYKMLRSMGLLDQLRQARIKTVDQSLSLN